MIQRFLAKKIAKYLSRFPAVAILGARQVGKTTLARSIIPQLKKEVVYIDLERPSHFKALTANPEMYLEQYKDQCIIIDEVQRYPAIFPILRPAIDDYRVPGRFLLLGSASPTLLKDSSESLAGRIMYTELPTLHLLELKKNQTLNNLWVRGGFPEPFAEKQETAREDWYTSFLMTYFERDLNMLGLNLSSDLLARTFNMIAHMQGGPCNMSKLSGSLTTDRRTIERILQFFMSSYMVRKLNPFFVNTKKRLVKSPKYYIRDSGILHHTLGIHSLQELMKNPVLGCSWEGFIIEQVINLGTSLLPYFYRTQAGAECDLVLVKGNQPVIAIEAKLTNTPKLTKSLHSSLKDLQTQENFIVTPSADTPYPITEDVTVCNLTWLLQYLRNKWSN